jgi:hypothetical protein
MGAAMTDELAKEEIGARARELARRVMSTPYRRQDWPKAPATDLVVGPACNGAKGSEVGDNIAGVTAPTTKFVPCPRCKGAGQIKLET